MVSLGSCGFSFLPFSLPFSCFFLQIPCSPSPPTRVSSSEDELTNASPPSPQDNLFQRVHCKPSPSFASVLCVSRLRRKILIGQSLDYLSLSQLSIYFCPMLINWRIGGILQDCGEPKFTSSAWIVVLYLRDSSERRRYLIAMSFILSDAWLVCNK